MRVEMTTMDSEEGQSWDDLYKKNDVKEIPWYEKNLDLGMGIELDSLEKGEFLDLGTGPGTQAIEIAEIGFKVTGSDISESAIKKAKEVSNKVNFVVDNTLESKFEENSFDHILDRGCFHIFSQNKRMEYLKYIKRILRKNGIVFLKCMSKKERDLSEDDGSQKFSEIEIREYFEKDFEIIKIKDTVYYGKVDPLPKALFVVMKKIESMP
ncbi:class I SAM-dependent methyltransferase [Nitrosopumilus sp.]|uniref:class I SAM-dependent methyltransferase n=1 Tax=Nitrosopumilus sp. TaxID=2024843 RepID=UPI00292F0096|nr:class I SAM-dependent methyltransferase [Nitrosopumilus sp.]